MVMMVYRMCCIKKDVHCKLASLLYSVKWIALRAQLEWYANARNDVLLKCTDTIHLFYLHTQIRTFVRAHHKHRAQQTKFNYLPFFVVVVVPNVCAYILQFIYTRGFVDIHRTHTRNSRFWKLNVRRTCVCNQLKNSMNVRSSVYIFCIFTMMMRLPLNISMDFIVCVCVNKCFQFKFSAGRVARVFDRISVFAWCTKLLFDCRLIGIYVPT